MNGVSADRPVWSGLGSHLDRPPRSGLLPDEAFLNYSWALRQPKTGQLLGVMSADLRLLELDRILQSIELGDRARAFVFTEDGWLLASSGRQRIGPIAIRPPEHLSKTADPILRSANYYLLDRFGGFRYFPPQSTQLYSFGGQRYLMHLVRCQSAIAPGLWIGVIAPEADFLSETQSTASTLALLAGAALLLAVASAWWMVQQVLRPLQQLNRAAGAVARIQFQPVSDRSGVIEFDALADTFNAMAATLRTTFDALQENEARLSQVLESLPIGVVALDAAGHVHYINSVAAYLFELPTGRQPSKVTCEALHDRIFCAGSDRPFPHDQLPGCIALTGKVSGAVQLDIQQGQRRVPLDVRAVPLFDNMGQVTGAIVVLQDITDRKIAEELLVSYNQTLEQQVMERTAALEIASHHLASARDTAEQANRAKTVFLANVTHELRTPLHAILGFGQLLRAALASTASTVSDRSPVHSTSSYLDAIARNGAYLLQLIDDLLSISHMEAEQLSLEIGDVNLRALLSDLFDIFEMRSRSTGIRLQMAINPNLPASVRGDGRRLRQILTNLLDNAFKFADSLGEVSLMVLPGPNPGDWEFAVRNTGPGIHPHELSTIFEPFVQASAGRSSGQGTGLGLAICHNLAQLMGGRLTAESQPGQLTTFRLLVSLVPSAGGTLGDAVSVRSPGAQRSSPAPIANGLSTVPAPLADPTDPESISAKILLVDALVERAQDYHHHLASEGFAVRSVTTGRDALRQYATWHPHLVWFHLPLAGDEGLATLRRIRAIERKQSRSPCKAIVVFARSDVQPDWQALDCTLLKVPLPIGPALVEAVRGLLEPAPVCPWFPTAGGRLLAGTNAIPDRLQSQLAAQSLAWRSALERAARSADEEAIHQLLTELTPESQDLREAIEHWVSEFQLERIADWASPLELAPDDQPV